MTGQPTEPRVLTVEEFRQLKTLIEDWQGNRLMLNAHMLAEHGFDMRDIAWIMLTIAGGLRVEPFQPNGGGA